MVEGMHRQLKVALKAKLTNHDWVNLPFVLSGMRAAVKEDIGSSSASLVYGMNLRLPGQFFRPSDIPNFSPESFRFQLEKIMTELRPHKPKFHKKQSTFYIPRELKDCTHVFVRHDATRSPFDQPYDGPFEVIERHDKFFKLKLTNRVDNVSIDRLKPAFLETQFEYKKSRPQKRHLVQFLRRPNLTQTSSVVIPLLIKLFLLQRDRAGSVTQHNVLAFNI